MITNVFVIIKKMFLKFLMVLYMTLLTIADTVGTRFVLLLHQNNNNEI